MARKGKPTTARGGRLVNRAFGPAAEEFGEEIRPVGKEVGALTARTTRALLKPVSGLVWAFEKIEEWITESVEPKVERIPPEHRVEPPLIIAGPAIEAMRYCGSEPYLREMFATLLAAAMDTRSVDKSHPAFIEIIKQLCPDEAKLLNYIARKYPDSWPVIELYTLIDRKADRDAVLSRNFGPFTLVAFYAGCVHIRQTPVYIGNLLRLKILDLDYPSPIDKVSLEELLDHHLVSSIRAEILAHPGAFKFHFETGWLTLTPFGQQFLDVSVRPRSGS